jgi:hypothetical protein
MFVLRSDVAIRRFLFSYRLTGTIPSTVGQLSSLTLL